MLFLNSCRSWFEVVDADTSFENKEYFTAAELYIKDYDQEEDDLIKSKLASRIGDCFRNSNKTIEAEKWYEKALIFSVDPEDYFKYALMLKSNEKYEEAILVLKEYSFSNPTERAKAKKQINSCRLADEWKKEKTDIVISNLQDINSDASDYAPVWIENKGLLFTSARTESKGENIYGWTGEKHSDLYFAEAKANQRFGVASTFSDSLNTKYNEGTLTFTPDYKSVYFTRCGSDELINNYCNIYFSTAESEGNWSKPERLILFETDSINVGQPFFSPDGEQLYFSADAPDSYGDKDIYVVNQTVEGWSYPKNLGPKINTSGYEGFPFIHTDGRLYFASDGHLGMGGLDIFVAEYEKKQWVNPQNLKYPINSSADDFSLIYQPYILPDEMDKIVSKGYLASTRKGGKGNDDVYQFVVMIPQEEEIVEAKDSSKIENADSIPDITEKEKIVKIVLNVKVLENQFQDADNPNSSIIGKQAVPNAVVEILGLDIESEIAARLITDGQGTCSLDLEPESEYKVTASNSGYFTNAKKVVTQKGEAGKTKVIELEFILDKIYRQQEIVVDNIYYDLDKANIRSDAEPTLNTLAELLSENPDIVVEFGSHTDSRGTARYNLNLSQERAEAVVNYLASKKIDRRRLIAKGYGETNLVNDCVDGADCSEEEHQQNRRTTFKVVSDRFRAE